jgi:altronate dehydratase
MRTSLRKDPKANHARREARVPADIETAAYIGEMCAELSKLAGAADLPMLGYFLNLARVEAQIYLRENDPRAAVREP